MSLCFTEGETEAERGSVWVSGLAATEQTERGSHSLFPAPNQDTMTRQQ